MGGTFFIRDISIAGPECVGGVGGAGCLGWGRRLGDAKEQGAVGWVGGREEIRCCRKLGYATKSSDLQVVCGVPLCLPALSGQPALSALPSLPVSPFGLLVKPCRSL